MDPIEPAAFLICFPGIRGAQCYCDHIGLHSLAEKQPHGKSDLSIIFSKYCFWFVLRSHRSGHGQLNLLAELVPSSLVDRTGNISQSDTERSIAWLSCLLSHLDDLAQIRAPKFCHTDIGGQTSPRPEIPRSGFAKIPAIRSSAESFGFSAAPLPALNSRPPWSFQVSRNMILE